MKLTLASSWAFPLMSVASSSCSAKTSLDIALSSSYFKMLADMSAPALIKLSSLSYQSHIFHHNVYNGSNSSGSSSIWQFILLVFSQHKKIDNRIKTTEKGMQVTKQIDAKHTHIF